MDDSPIDDDLEDTFIKEWNNDRQIFIRRLRNEIESPQQSFINNLKEALKHTTEDPNEVLFFIEDDDYYHPSYLPTMLERMQHNEIAGLAEARYYNLRSRAFTVFPHTIHASLSATALRGSRARSALNAAVLQCEGEKLIHVDLRFYDHARALRIPTELLPQLKTLQVGIKGMPGRKGLGIGHRPPPGWPIDGHNFDQLRSWLKEDICLYLPYINSEPNLLLQ